MQSSTPLLNRTSCRSLLVPVAAVLVGITGTLVVQRVHADGIPAQGALTYTGKLTAADGALVNGSKNIGLIVFDAAVDGNRLCDVLSTPVNVTAGSFQIRLPESCVLAVKKTPELWVEIQVDGGATGRTRLGAVPYAIEADRASNAGGPLNARIAALETAKDALNTRTAALETSAGSLDTRTSALEAAKGTLGGNATSGYFQPPNWGHSAKGAEGTVWTTLWSASITVPADSVLTVAVNGHWIVDAGWCYLAVAIDSASLADGTCGADHSACAGALHTYSTTWEPVGYTAAGMVTKGAHVLNVQVRPYLGTTCQLNGARLYWTAIPR